MPGPPPAGQGRRSPAPYAQYPPHSNSNNNASREDVRIPDIGGGRAPTPSDRSQMNPILHDERQHHQQQIQQQIQQQQQQQQHHMPTQQGQTNLPPMSMRQPYKTEETRSPNPVNAQAPPPPLSSSPHSRPSPRTSSHPLAPPQQYNDHRLSPRTGHSESYRYEHRSPAQRPMEMESSASPRSRPDYGRMKHEEPSYSNLPPRNLEHRYSKPQTQHEEVPTVVEKKASPEAHHQRQHVVDEDYDESAADVLLSMGNPQLGQKRALQHEHEDNKKPRIQPETLEMETETKEEEQDITETVEKTIVEEKEEGENDDEDELIEESIDEQSIKNEEEQEEGEVDEKEEGEVKDDDDEITQKEMVPTAAVAATTASVAASQQKEENNSPVDEPAGSA